MPLAKYAALSSAIFCLIMTLFGEVTLSGFTATDSTIYHVGMIICGVLTFAFFEIDAWITDLGKELRKKRVDKDTGGE